MSQSTTKSVIMADTVIEGDVVARGTVTLNGRVQGSVSAHSVEISETGAVYGSLRAQSADVNGAVQGDVAILGLIRIGKTGSVSGDVVYGKISMDQGGELSASLRNVPPKLGGDLHITVPRGGSVRITTLDLTAFDPDDSAHDLIYSVSSPAGGHVALAPVLATAVQTFTQADLEAGRVMFVHDGASGGPAGFDVIVADAKGATSGATRHVTADVRN